jgi:hypothetical protein
MKLTKRQAEKFATDLAEQALVKVQENAGHFRLTADAWAREMETLGNEIEDRLMRVEFQAEDFDGLIDHLNVNSPRTVVSGSRA